MDRTFSEFLELYPAFRETQKLDNLRETEYKRLDAQGHIYLDYAGGGVYAESQLREHMALLQKNVFGNPHSTNPTSLAMTHLIEDTRRYVLEYFHASPDEYVVIFTPNASGGLKLVGESYPFEDNGHYLLTFDNHNSVNGIREFARSRGAKITYIPMELPDMRIDGEKLADYLKQAHSGGNNLFAYPAQSNFSGVQHPLDWIEQAQSLGWDVLLDAGAFVPTNMLDLSQWKPNFVPLSFYKMFGYPTGVGCLLARKDSLMKLHRPWFAGGTITVASVQGDKYYLAEDEVAFEDGTLNYLTLPAIKIGLQHLASIGIETIHERVCSLTGWLLNNLLTLQHSNGKPLLRFYGPLSSNRRGGTIAMNFYDAAGQFFDHRQIEAEANKVNISLRTGCFCNPGGRELALGLSQTELVGCFTGPQERLTADDFRLCIDDKSSGAVRISVGLVSNFADVFHFLQFAQSFIDKSAEALDTSDNDVSPD